LKINYKSSGRNIWIDTVDMISIIDYCCPMMKKLFAEYNNRDFGIDLFFDEDVPEARLNFVSTFHGRGVMKIEYCPFCGEKIFLYNRDKKEIDH
jgi:hypothetical protein